MWKAIWIMQIQLRTPMRFWWQSIYDKTLVSGYQKH